MIAAPRGPACRRPVVIADEDDVGVLQVMLDHDHHLFADGIVDGAPILVFDANHLLRMAVLGLADVAFLDGAGPR